ncbi:MAG TPA: alpha/beta hydrolase [Pseudonocardiaceae bacterium]|jgi:pimeloyl-ACP methyl ester carboxylesterase|nr:alpha/beta hydrolase [Pseudonocardiaceae bacterium]
MASDALPRTRRRWLIGAGILTVTAGVAGALTLVPAAQANDTAVNPVQTSIAWGACPALAPGATRDPRETCGTVTVPLDYRNPQGGTITVEVSRIATAKPGRKRGDLLLNPGGPGLEGLDMPTTIAPTLPASVLEDYDLIGFDPRGVGHSSPMSCGLTDPSEADAFPYPAANGSIQANVANARDIAQHCATIGAELKYFTTANTARDLDRIRQALGVPRISYWGQSYGTYLGAVYTALFPQHTDRMVLEGNVDPNTVWAPQIQLWNRGMNARFPDAAKAAAADDADLGLGRTSAQVTANFLALAARLDRTPAAVPGTPVSISGAILRAVTYQMLLHNETLAPLTQFWKAAADLAAGRTPTATDTSVLQQVFADAPTAPGVPADNQIAMSMALVCGDVAWSRNVAGYAKATAASRAAYPLSDGMPANIWPCAFWSQAPIELPVRVTSNGPRDVLILQNRRDNATPWESGLGMRKALGARAGFVGVDNGGHYVYGTGSTCADQATVAFLANGTLPSQDLYCAGPKS